MTAGAKRAAIFLFLFASVLAAANLIYTTRTVDNVRHQQQVECKFDADLGTAPIIVPAARHRRDYTIYECPDCGERLYGEQRCQPCRSFARRIGIGGLCPHCDQPVALSDLIDQPATIMPNR